MMPEQGSNTSMHLFSLLKIQNVTFRSTGLGIKYFLANGNVKLIMAKEKRCLSHSILNNKEW